MALLVGEIAGEADALLSRSRDLEDEARLERIAEALELVISDSRVDAPPLLEGFLSALAPGARARIDAYLRPASQRLAQRMATQDTENERPLSRAATPRLRPRPRRYSGRAPRRRRRL